MIGSVLVGFLSHLYELSFSIFTVVNISGHFVVNFTHCYRETRWHSGKEMGLIDFSLTLQIFETKNIISITNLSLLTGSTDTADKLHYTTDKQI